MSSYKGLHSIKLLVAAFKYPMNDTNQR